MPNRYPFTHLPDWQVAVHRRVPVLGTVGAKHLKAHLQCNRSMARDTPAETEAVPLDKGTRREWIVAQGTRQSVRIG